MQAYPFCGKNASHTAVLTSSDRSIRLIDSNGLNVREQAYVDPITYELWDHVANGNIMGIEACLVMGADANALGSYVGSSHEPTGTRTMPPLIAALCRKHGWVEIIEKLLEHGADPDVYDGGGSSAYCYALKTEDPNTIKVMVTALAAAQSSGFLLRETIGSS
jgi:hypothetical protein